MKAMEKPELRPRASGGYGKGTVTQAHKYKCMHKYASVRAQTQNTYNTQIRIIYAHDRTQAIQYIQNTNTHTDKKQSKNKRKNETNIRV